MKDEAMAEELIRALDRHIKGLKAIAERLDRIEEKIDRLDVSKRRRLDGTPRTEFQKLAYSQAMREE